MNSSFFTPPPSIPAALLALGLALPASAGLVQNPSFESNYPPNWPHYGAIDGWSGGNGVNYADGPFHNAGTAVPDQISIGFQQGNGTISQAISGLEPDKKYWLQFYYDSRSGGSVDMTVKWDDVVVDSVTGIVPSTTGAYRFRNVRIEPTSDFGTIGIQSSVVTDSTLLLDSVCLVRRDDGQAVLQNPGFEASGDLPDIGVATGNIAGWVIEGTVGINSAAGPFADNGTIPEQDHALFIQRLGSVSQTIKGLVSGQSYTLTLKVNARNTNTPHLEATANGAVVIGQDVTPVGGAAAYRTVTGNFTADSDTVELKIAQTVNASDQTLLVDDVQLAGAFVAPLPDLKIGPNALELAPGGTGLVSVTVSAERLKRGESVIKLRIDNPAIAEFVDVENDGLVTLTFPANAPETTLTTELEGFERGLTRVVVEDSGGHDGVQNNLTVNVVTSFVRNASFEGNGVPAYPGTGVISAWSASGNATGLNTSAGPFADNGNIPDRVQTAFLQQNATLSQTIYGLIPGKNYRVQFQYNARNCCGATPSLRVNLNAGQLLEIKDIQPAGAGSPYYSGQAEFTATAETADLSFISDAGGGDASVLLDGVSIVQRDPGEITVVNPSFEASGIATGVGYVQPAGIAGWTMTGGYGVNIDGRGPFTDNGIADAQDRVLFMQNNASATQTVFGLTAGKAYTLSFLLNARAGDAPGGTPYQILVDGNILEEGSQDPVGAGQPYAGKALTFTASSDQAEIRFNCVPPGAEDQTLLLDDVRVTPAGAVTGIPLTIETLAGNSVVLRWPASAPASLVLMSSTSLQPASWTTVLSPVTVVNGQNTVIEPFNGTKRFYRLVQP